MSGKSQSLPLWWPLFLVILVILAVCLKINFDESSAASVETPNVGHVAAAPKIPVANKPVNVAPRTERAAPAANSAALVAAPEPVLLDEETAREAVHAVETSVYARATRMFDEEPIDIAWAGDYEQALRDMFSQHQGLQKVSVNSISCHTSMCRIEVFTPRDADADFFTAMFYEALAQFRSGELKGEAAITRRMEVGMTSVYVARRDYQLGFY